MTEPNCVWDTLAEKYDRLWVQKHSLAPTRTVVRQKIRNLFHGTDFTLLDLGCGTGQLLAELRREHMGCRLFGADKSPEMVRLAKSKEKSIDFFCADADESDLCRIFPEKSIDAVVCCHSFPYYKNKPAVLHMVHALLTDGGIAIFAQASVNNLYDKLVLRAVEATAEKADYLSRKAFRALVQDRFEITDEFSVRERFFMPSICGFVLRKRA